MNKPCYGSCKNFKLSNEYIAQIKNGENFMKKYELREWQLSKITLFFCLYTSIAFSMEIIPEVLSVVQQKVEFFPKKTISLFDPKKESEKGRLWDEVVPGELIVTPDEKGVIITDHGRVRYAQFDTGNIDVIIKHQCIKKIPLVAVAQKQDGSLLVVSVCNYYSEQDNKNVAEYAVYSHGSSRFHHLQSPIQAISLDATGDILAMAILSSVMVMNLNTKETKEAFFKKKNFLDDTHWIVDIAMHPIRKWIVIAGSHEDIQWLSYDDKLSNDKQVKTTDKIKKIYYPSVEEILYLTDRGEAKVVKMAELMEKDNNFIVDTVSLATSLKYDKVVADLSEQIAVAYWTNNIKMAHNIRQKIKMYRKDDMRIDKIILNFSDLEDLYNYRTSSGKQDFGIGHLLHVALRGKTIVALATDGKMRLWSLGEQNKYSIEPEIIKKESRGRSNSIKHMSSNSSGGDEQLKNDRIVSQKSRPFSGKNPQSWSFISSRRSRENSPNTNEKEIIKNG